MAELQSIRQMIQKWRRDGVALLPPHDEDELIRELSRLGRPFSRDVVGLYCATGGMDNDMDGECLTLWTLEQVVTENLKSPRPQLLFMDFLINSHCYGLQYEDANTSSVYIDYFVGETQRVANSLDEFFQISMTDCMKLFV
jgi:hypothetical protein